MTDPQDYALIFRDEQMTGMQYYLGVLKSATAEKAREALWRAMFPWRCAGSSRAVRVATFHHARQGDALFGDATAHLIITKKSGIPFAEGWVLPLAAGIPHLQFWADLDPLPPFAD